MFRAVVSILPCLWASTAAAAPAIGLTLGNTLVFFDTTAPGSVARTVPLTGLSGGETMLAIDHRPISGQLYGVSTASVIYTIDPTSGMVQPVRGGFMPAIASSGAGLDFDPVLDRLRLVSDGGQHLELSTLSGQTIAELPLAYAAGDPGSGSTPRLVALAHSNNFLGATTTEAFAIDAARDTLVRIDPRAATVHTIGPLGVDADDSATLDLAGGVAYAALNVAGAPALFFVVLGSGATTRIGELSTGLRGLALPPPGSVSFSRLAYAAPEDAGPLVVEVQRSGGAAGAVTVEVVTSDGSAKAGEDYDQTRVMVELADGEISASVEIPLRADREIEPNETFTLTLQNPTGGVAIGTASAEVTIVNDEGVRLRALTASHRLLSIEDSDPSVIISTATISGLAAGESLIGLDYAENGVLHALGATRRLYRIDTASGVATAISAMPFAPELQGNAFGFDLEPGGRLARITSDGDQHLALDAVTATGAAARGRLHYPAGDPNAGENPAVTALAFAEGAGGTTLYGLDIARDALVRIDARTGALATTGALGPNAGSTGGFDILPGAPVGHAALVIGFGNPTLHSVDLTSGALSVIGAIPIAEPLVGIALEPAGRFGFAQTVYTGREGEVLRVDVVRTGGDNGPARVAVEVTGGTATPGDYELLDESVDFGSGQSRATLQVRLSNDLDTEPTETMVLRFAATGARIGNPSSATISIDDGPPIAPDAGVADGGAMELEDAAQAEAGADATAGTDAATSAADAGEDPAAEGCGCASTRRSGSSPWLLMMLLLVAGLRRRC